MGEIAAANVILALLALKPTENESDQGEATSQIRKGLSQKELFDKTELTGLTDWSLDDQKQAWELITENTSIFAMSNMDLGKGTLERWM